jgi:hypothetical protein
MPPTVRPLIRRQDPNPSPNRHRETTPTPRTQSPRTPTKTRDGVSRRATSCNDRSNFMRYRVRNRASEWKRLGERTSSRLDSSRGSHTFHRRPAAPTFQQRYLHARRSTTAARLHGFRASKIPVVKRMGAGTAKQMGFHNVSSPDTGRKQMATHYRPTPPEQVLQGPQTHVRDTLAPHEPDASRRLDGFLRPRGRPLHTRHTGKRHGLLYGKLSRHAVPSSWPSNGLET